MKTLFHSLCVVAVTLAVSCVDHRPVRNGLRDEAVYLEKQTLTANNPKTPAEADDGWLFKVTVVKTSSPNVLGDYAFPGMESELKYVKFRFGEDSAQMLDGRALQKDDPNDKNDDLSTRTERVLMEFPGSNVDMKLRENLDGERTNFLEENTELPWQERQHFRVDLEKTSLDPITAMAWFYGYFLHDCAKPVSTRLIPGSFEQDNADQYMSWVIEANYEVNVTGGCYDMVSLAEGVGTVTLQYRLSFYRPDRTNYTPEVIEEKDAVNKKYGTFQLRNLFRDSQTGILSAKSLLQRWNPARTEDVVFYFHPGFPEKFKPMFADIANRTNEELKGAAKFKVKFMDPEKLEDGSYKQKFGDIRYSFAVWHQDIDSTRGLLGYGPSSSNPKTGEVISANLNLYNIGMDYYRFLIQDYLERFEGAVKPDASKPWEQIACQEGQTLAPAMGSKNLSSDLFKKMRVLFDIREGEETGTREDFLPKYRQDKDSFVANYQKLLPELRYTEPNNNPYTYRTAGNADIAQFRELTAKEKSFQDTLSRIARNENPFGPVGLTTAAGIKKQLEFRDQFNSWRKDHEQLESMREYLLGMNNISTFDPNDAISALSRSARQCQGGFWESDKAYSDRIIENVVYHVAIHEFGHNMGLRHNFYGSVDAKHMAEGALSSSVMDYVAAQEEAGSVRGWGEYDKAALKWIYGDKTLRETVMAKDFLFCTDEHRRRSPLCQAHDLGVTPSQIVLNAIERYDHLYTLRNHRAYRTFWDTSGYSGSVYNAIFPLQRFFNLASFDWGYGGVQNTLKRLDQLGGGVVKSDPEYNEIATDYTQDVMAAVKMTTAFYDGVINQASAYRNYQTQFDPYYGDILQMGIILDKLYTTVAFMDFQSVSNYSPNIETYISWYDSPFGSEHAAMSKRVLDNMLGANYDTFPWFRYYAMLIYSSVANTNLVGSIELKERIAIRRFERASDFEAEFGANAIAEALREGNDSQQFAHQGEIYTYTYLADRGWHLVSSKSRSPVSFQFMSDYNESLNGASTTKDNYGLKVILAYHEFYNNFSGY